MELRHHGIWKDRFYGLGMKILRNLILKIIDPQEKGHMIKGRHPKRLVTVLWVKVDWVSGWLAIGWSIGPSGPIRSAG